MVTIKRATREFFIKNVGDYRPEHVKETMKILELQSRGIIDFLIENQKTFVIITTKDGKPRLRYDLTKGEWQK